MDLILINKLIKFIVVGFSGLSIDFSTTWILKEKVKINKYIANAIGFMLAASSNYFFNRIWTFESHNPHIKKEYFSFIIISVVGLGINSFFLWLFIKKFRINFYIAKLFAIFITTIWNFFANLLITFN